MSDSVQVTHRHGRVHIRVETKTQTESFLMTVPLADVVDLVHAEYTIDLEHETVEFQGYAMPILVYNCLIARLESILLGFLVKSSVELLMTVGLDLDAGTARLSYQEHMAFRDAVRIVTGQTYGLASPPGDSKCVG
jgi:hypothetical protein